MCDCKSYNQPEKTGSIEEVIIDPRPYITGATKAVCVDACIATQILELWACGIETAGSCCGHNRTIGPPSVFLVDPRLAAKAAKVLSSIDVDRDWQILCWSKSYIAPEKTKETP